MRLGLGRTETRDRDTRQVCSRDPVPVEAQETPGAGGRELTKFQFIDKLAVLYVKFYLEFILIKTFVFFPKNNLTLFNEPLMEMETLFISIFGLTQTTRKC